MRALTVGFHCVSLCCRACDCLQGVVQVHVLSTASSRWYLRQMLWGASETEGFGLHVAMVADVMVVAAPLADAGAGALYLYHRLQTGEFEFVGRLTPDDAEAGDGFGSALTLYKASPFYRLVVGAPSRNDSRGAAYMYLLDPGLSSWNQSDMLLKPDSYPGDYFGSSISGYCESLPHPFVDCYLHSRCC